MIWTYFSWSQFLITWAGNLPEEIAFFLPRIHGGFGWVALAIVLFHFMVPFALLLSRDLKRNGQALRGGAAWLLFMRWVELFWQVEPAFHGPRAAHHRSTAPASTGSTSRPRSFIGGVWLFFFARTLKSRPLLPLQRPLSCRRRSLMATTTDPHRNLTDTQGSPSHGPRPRGLARRMPATSTARSTSGPILWSGVWLAVVTLVSSC